MPNCVKCGADLPAGALFCHLCGKKQLTQQKRSSKRANGTGSVYKRGKSWEAAVVLGHTFDGGNEKPVRVTKGGFKTKKEAPENIPPASSKRSCATPTSPPRKSISMSP